MPVCSKNHRTVTYDIMETKNGCPLCEVINEMERLKRELGEKQYFKTELRLDRETYERLMRLSDLFGPVEGFNEPLEKATKLGIEALILQIEEQNK